MGMLGKIFGAGLGWALFGPLGAIMGYFIASSVDSSRMQSRFTGAFKQGEATDNPAGDFLGALMVLFAAVAKADSRVDESEVQYVDRYLRKRFGEGDVADLMRLFNLATHRQIDHRAVSNQVKNHLDYYSRLQLIQMLYGLANADGRIDPDENRILADIITGLGIKSRDHMSIKAIYFKDEDGAYKVLGLTREATDDEIKSAYRSLVRKYHPDKVSHLGDEFIELAEEKFRALNEAYEQIRRERGF